jgi:hypothetical protein
MNDTDKDRMNAVCWVIIALLFASAAYSSKKGMSI